MSAAAKPDADDPQAESAFRYGMRIVCYRIAVAATFLALWEVLARNNWVNVIFVSYPSRIGVKFWEWVLDGTIVRHAGITLYEAGMGWLLASVVGILIGFITANWKTLDLTLAPFIDALNATPRFALASLFIIWFGIGVGSKIALVFSVIVIILILATNNAAKSVDPDLVTLLRVMGASRRELFAKVVLPWCLPFIISALRLSIAWALAGAVVGEMLVSQSGLGNLIAAAASVLDTTSLFAAVLVVVLIAYVASLVLTAVENKLLSWRPEVLKT